MISYEEALEIIFAQSIELGSQSIPTLEAINRITSKSVFSPFDLPRFTNSAMDGFAFKWNESLFENNNPSLNVVGESAAGSPFNGNVSEGEAIKISTGAALPPVVDTVVPKEKVENQEHRITINENIRQGFAVRKQGEDLRKGEEIIGAGKILHSQHLGLLSFLNQENVHVVTKPKVAILTSGEELRPLGSDLKDHQIINSNSYYLASALEKAGCHVSDFGVSKDNAADFQKILRSALDWADIVVSTAGVSVGDHDVVPNSVSALGGETLFWRIALRPGKPMLFAKFDKNLFFGFPGNPVSVFTGVELFLKPFLRKISSVENYQNTFERAILNEPAKPDRNRLFFALGQLSVIDGKPTVSVINMQSSGNFHNTTIANCFVKLTPSEKEVSANSEVEILCFQDCL